VNGTCVAAAADPIPTVAAAHAVRAAMMIELFRAMALPPLVTSAFAVTNGVEPAFTAANRAEFSKMEPRQP
jgi:hypothetical protein